MCSPFRMSFWAAIGRRFLSPISMCPDARSRPAAGTVASVVATRSVEVATPLGWGRDIRSLKCDESQQMQLRNRTLRIERTSFCVPHRTTQCDIRVPFCLGTSTHCARAYPCIDSIDCEARHSSGSVLVTRGHRRAVHNRIPSCCVSPRSGW